MPKRGDFIKIEIEGRDEDGNVFDSTKGDIAKNIHGKEGPLLIALGKDAVISGLEEALFTMNAGEEKTITLIPEKAFGRRKRNLVKIIPTNDLLKNNIKPEPGVIIYVNTDSGRIYGTVKSVSSGRAMVDFNHPLANKKVTYNVKMVEILSDSDSKIKAIMENVGLNGTYSIEGETLKMELSKDANDYDAKKALLLIKIRTYLPEIKKFDIKEKA